MSFTKAIKIEQEELTISDFYINVLNLNLSFQDHQNSKICTRCFDKLKEYYEFKTNAITNDKFYRLFITGKLKLSKYISCISLTDLFLGPKENCDESDEESKNAIEIAEVPVDNRLYLKEEALDISDHHISDTEINEDTNSSDKILSKMIPPDEFKDDEESEDSDSLTEESQIKTTKRIRIRRHKNSQNPEKVQCDYCKSWLYKESIAKHIKRLHENVANQKYTKDFKCNQCDKAFVTNWQLKYHINVHSNKREFQCRFCDLSYFRHFHLKRHMLEKHVTNVVFKCQICPHKFQKKPQIVQHLKKIHKELSKEQLQKEIGKVNSVCLEFIGEVPEEFVQTKQKLKCPMCKDFEFEKPSRLKLHLITRHLKLKVKCEFCKLEFTRKNQLRSHLILKHKDKHGIEKVSEAWDKVRDLQLSELDYNKDIPDCVKDIIGRKRRILDVK
jgi:hypothetical protein